MHLHIKPRAAFNGGQGGAIAKKGTFYSTLDWWQILVNQHRSETIINS